ncbi:MAG: GDSL-type esterase/lipase family protein [Roseburia sp.]|nr:GDSL-type esterase/lipase family protein [Roseburia sp.]
MMKGMKFKWGKRLTAFLLVCMVMAMSAGEGMAVWGADTAIITGTLTDPIDSTEPTETPESEPVYSLSKTSMTMAPATTTTLKLKGATASKVTWKSSKKTVATVDKSGKVTALTKGTADIKATYQGKTYKCKVTVKYKTYTAKDGITYKDAKGEFGRTGRWFKKSIAGGKYYFTNTGGSAIYFKVTGSKYINVNFVQNIGVATPYFAYSVDGGSMKRQKVNSSKISVGNTKTHYVRLVVDAIAEQENRWGEAGVGIKSIKPVTKGGVVTALQPQNAMVAFYGDSITEGVRALNMALLPTGTSATHSYAWYCAGQLDMVPYYAGYGGSGIVKPGSYNNCYNAITSFSSGRKAEKYDADVIVVEHGTNDVDVAGSVFTSEYRNVLQKLHSDHSKAYIMAMIPLNQSHAQDIRDAARGLKYVTVVETASWGLSYTDGLHPNSSGGKTMGKNLAKKIAAKRKAVLK